MIYTKTGRLALRGFLEGVEVPVVSAVVTSGEGAPAQLSMQIVPSPVGIYLLPRTGIEVFRLVSGGDPDKSADWETFFVGELADIRFHHDRNSGDALILIGVDKSAVLDSAWMYQLSFGPNGTGFFSRIQQFIGAQPVSDDITKFQTYLKNILHGKPKSVGLSDPEVKGILAGLINLIEQFAGAPGKLDGTNDFFSIWELKNKFLYQLGSDTGNAAIALFDQKWFYDFLNNRLNQIGSLATLRQAIDMLFGFIYYGMTPNTSPFYIPATPKQITQRTTVVSYDKERAGLEEVQRKLEHFEFDGQVSVTSLEDSMLESASKNDFWRNASVIGAVGPYILQMGECSNLLKTAASTVSLKDSSAGARLLDAANQLETASTNLSLAVADLSSRQSALTSGASAIAAARNTVTGLASSLKNKTATSKKTVVSGGRLITQILCPDLWYAAPPKCNVIFPEEYQSTQFGRSTLRETSRYLLTASPTLGGQPVGGQLFQSSYFAPYNPLSADPKKLNGKLLPHEKFGGIIPIWEHVSNMSYHAARDGVVTTQLSHKEYMERSAFLAFYRSRFAARNLTVSSALLTRLVVGMPACVITDAFSDESLAMAGLVGDPTRLMSVSDQKGGLIKLVSLVKSMGGGIGPLQYLGKISSVVHSITQQGEGTSLVISHARTQSQYENDYLTNDTVKSTQTARTVFDYTTALATGNALALCYLALASDQSALSTGGAPLLKPGLVGPKGGKITKIYVLERSSDPTLLPFRNALTTEDQEQQVRGILSDMLYKTQGLAYTLGNDNLTYEKIVGYPLNYCFRVEIEESTVETKLKSAGRNLEDELLPKWLSDNYNNENIGKKFYQPNIGCDSITDGVSEKALMAFSGGVGEVSKQSGISESVDLISILYGAIRAQGDGKVREFIDEYTRRRIASLEDIYWQDAKKDGPQFSVSSSGEVTNPDMAGFYGTCYFPAAADAGNLAGLLPAGVSGGTTPYAKSLDPRPERRSRVREYLATLRTYPVRDTVDP